MSFDTGRAEEIVEVNNHHRFTWLDQALRTTAIFNLALISLSFTKWFSGDPEGSGVADRLFGHIRLGGWRADVAWLLLSSCLLFFAFLYSLVEIRRTPARVNAALIFFALLSFCAYIHHLLHSGLLYMG